MRLGTKHQSRTSTARGRCGIRPSTLAQTTIVSCPACCCGYKQAPLQRRHPPTHTTLTKPMTHQTRSHARSCHLCYDRHRKQQQGRRNAHLDHGRHRLRDLVRRRAARSLVQSLSAFAPVCCHRERLEHHPRCSRHSVGALDFPCSDPGYSGSGDATCTADDGASTSQFVFNTLKGDDLKTQGCSGG